MAKRNQINNKEKEKASKQTNQKEAEVLKTKNGEKINEPEITKIRDN